MARCKCRICGASLDTSTAFKVNGKRPQYFCNQAEYDADVVRKQKASEDKDKVYRLVCDILGEKEIINSALYKEWAVWNKVADNEKIGKFLEENKDYLIMVIGRLTGTEYAKIRYVSAIIRDKIKAFKPKVELTEVLVAMKPSVAIDQTFEMYNGSTNISNRRRSFDEME